MTTSSRELRVQSVCLMIFAVIAVAGALYWLRPVLVPFVLSLFFACGLAPVLDLIERRLNAPRVVAVAIAFLLGLLLVALLWTMIYMSVASLARDSQVYINRWFELENNVKTWLGEVGEKLPTRSAVIGGDESTDAGDGHVAESTSPDIEPTQHALTDKEFKNTASGPPSPGVSGFLRENITAILASLSGTLMDLMSSATMVLIFMFFLLLGGSTDIVPRSGLWMEIESKIRNYIVTKSVISAVTGFVFGLVLWLFGVPLAIVFGLLAFLMNFIPNIGPIIAVLFPLPLILLDPNMSVGMMVLVITLASAVQFISGNIIEPKIMGDSFELHPVAILLTLMIWGMIWGIVGMFLATPLMAAAKIVLARFKRTKPVADLLAGKLDALDLDEEAEQDGSDAKG